MAEPRLIIERLPAQERLKELLTTEEERRRADGFGTERRKAEYLGWRHIVRRELGADVGIGYTPEGAPTLLNRPEHIGVSHSADFVAVIISDRPCAVDIERLERNFSAVSPRCISAAERRLASHPHLEAAVWCAKETLYKYGRRKGLDFLKDICIEKIDFDGGIIAGRICGGSSVEMQMEIRDNTLVVWVG